MSLVEMVNVTTGTGWQQNLCVGNTGPANSVGFPSLCLQDGPLGIRYTDHITAFPAGLTVGATWSKDLMYRRGKALGEEARLKGINVLLGPVMGPLGKVVAGGRNWESFGADPVLQGVASFQTIIGIQEEGVMACAKHYIANEQEHFRQALAWGLPNAISSNIDDRTMHELYLWPFAESVRAGVASVMCSYNQINNSYACGNSKLLNGILKDELGFQGFVQSDWLGQRSGVGSALAGLDMSMPGDGLHWADGKSLWGGSLTQAVLNGSVPVERIHDMATRVVAAWYQLGQDDRIRWPLPPPDGEGGPNFSSWTKEEVGKLHHASDDPTTGVVNKFIDAMGTGDAYHGWLAREIAQEGIVLVKNVDKTLPLARQGWTDLTRPKPPGSETTTTSSATSTTSQMSTADPYQTYAVNPNQTDSDMTNTFAYPDASPTSTEEPLPDQYQPHSVIYPPDQTYATEFVPNPYQSSSDAYPVDPELPKLEPAKLSELPKLSGRQEPPMTTETPFVVPKFKVGVFGEDAGPGRGPNACKDRGCNQGTLGSGWGSGSVDFIYLITPIEGLQLNFDKNNVTLSIYDTNTPDIHNHPEIVEDQDMCIVFVNADGGEGYITSDGIKGDRNDLYLQNNGDELIKSIAKRCGKRSENSEGSTIVVVHAIGPVILERWIDMPEVKAVLLANLPGEESGNALANVLFGYVDASGRLPYTVGKSQSDYGPGAQVMYYPNGAVPQQNFDEGLYIDYRHFDKHNIEPRYEFGYGLSYTDFGYSILVVQELKPKSPLPAPRPIDPYLPPIDTAIPDPSSALFPSNFRKLKKYIYPYINSIDEIKPGPYPYPEGYTTGQEPSQAGGAEGGNPDLYTVHLEVRVTVNNVGYRPGKEVVQLYLSFPDNVTDEITGEKIEFPPRVLRGFEKVDLHAREPKTVVFGLTRKDLSYWSRGAQNWVMPTEGKFTVGVGRSSRDIKLEERW